MPPKKKRKVLHVLFDTNAILADGFENLISKKAADAIREHSKHGDLDIVWLVPEIVRFEREYQMRDQFRDVLKPTKRVEQLLGADWGISQETIESAIASRIDQQLAAHKIVVRTCDATLVNLNQIVRDAAFRTAPFEPGKTEKGFRDAIICETFYQLANSLSSHETAVLVSNDKPAQRAVIARLPAARVLEDIEGLLNEINLRVGNVDAQTASLIESKASKLMLDFSNNSDPTALWNREKLYAAIWAKFQKEINDYWGNSNATVAEQFLAPTRLVKKEGTRVFFSSLYTANGQATTWVPDPSPDKQPISGGLLGTGTRSDPVDIDHMPLSSLTSANPLAESGSGYTIYTTPFRRSIITPLTTPINWNATTTLLTEPLRGHWETASVAAANVSILWSATLSKQMRLTRAKIDDLILLKASA